MGGWPLTLCSAFCGMPGMPAASPSAPHGAPTAAVPPSAFGAARGDGLGLAVAFFGCLFLRAIRGGAGGGS
eukprot:591335-Prymnesium_polylepis.1